MVHKLNVPGLAERSRRIYNTSHVFEEWTVVHDQFGIWSVSRDGIIIACHTRSDAFWLCATLLATTELGGKPSVQEI